MAASYCPKFPKLKKLCREPGLILISCQTSCASGHNPTLVPILCGVGALPVHFSTFAGHLLGLEYLYPRHKSSSIFLPDVFSLESPSTFAVRFCLVHPSTSWIPATYFFPSGLCMVPHAIDQCPPLHPLTLFPSHHLLPCGMDLSFIYYDSLFPVERKL